MPDWLFNVMFYGVFVVAGIMFVFIICFAFSSKLQGKMMGKQIKAARHMLDDVQEDLTKIGGTVINTKKAILDENEEALTDSAIKEANIEKEKIRIRAKALRDGLTGKDVMYCKHCGEAVDADSKFCKSCGKEL